jgi:hypothetical protein
MKLFNICILVFLIQSINCYALQELPDSLFKKAEQGDAGAQYRLGRRYYEGNGVTKDYTKAVFWIRKAAEQGNKKAQFRLGHCYRNGDGVSENRTQAVYWFRKAAEKGHSGAQYRLGYCYHYGEGVPKDLKQAVYWYRKAAEKGDLLAPYELKEINSRRNPKYRLQNQNPVRLLLEVSVQMNHLLNYQMLLTSLLKMLP